MPNNIDVIANDIQYIKRDVSEIKTKMESSYVTMEQFTPIRNLVFGTVTFVLLSFLGALTALVYHKI